MLEHCGVISLVGERRGGRNTAKYRIHAGRMERMPERREEPDHESKGTEDLSAELTRERAKRQELEERLANMERMMAQMMERIGGEAVPPAPSSDVQAVESTSSSQDRTGCFGEPEAAEPERFDLSVPLLPANVRRIVEDAWRSAYRRRWGVQASARTIAAEHWRLPQATICELWRENEGLPIEDAAREFWSAYMVLDDDYATRRNHHPRFVNDTNVDAIKTRAQRAVEGARGVRARAPARNAPPAAAASPVAAASALATAVTGAAAAAAAAAAAGAAPKAASGRRAEAA